MIEIKQIKYLENLNDLKDVIVEIDWEYSLEGFQSISGTLALPQPEKDYFIPIEKITQEIAIEWVRQQVDPESRELQKIEDKPEMKTLSF